MGKEFRLQKNYCRKKKSPTLGNKHQMRSLNIYQFLTRILETFFSVFHILLVFLVFVQIPVSRISFIYLQNTYKCVCEKRE